MFLMKYYAHQDCIYVLKNRVELPVYSFYNHHVSELFMCYWTAQNTVSRCLWLFPCADE